MRLALIFALVAGVVGVIKDIAFGESGNGLMVVVFGLLIASVICVIRWASAEDLERSEKENH